MKMSLPARYTTAAIEAAGVDLSSATDQAWFDVPFKCQVVYAACAVSTVISGAAVVKFDRQAMVQSATGRTDGTIGTVNIPDATVIGSVIYDKAAQSSLTEAAAALLVTEATCEAGGGVWDSTNSKCINAPYGQLEPGNQVVVQVISGTTGAVIPMLVVELDDEVFGNLGNCTETT